MVNREQATPKTRNDLVMPEHDSWLHRRVISSGRIPYHQSPGRTPGLREEIPALTTSNHPSWDRLVRCSWLPPVGDVGVVRPFRLSALVRRLLGVWESGYGVFGLGGGLRP